MLENLHIKNYRLFRDLKIPKLGRINLVAGTNNVGKTALLEALRIYASKGDSGVINNIIYKRGDWDDRSDVSTYSSIIYNKKIKQHNSIQINDLELRIELTNDGNYIENFYAHVGNEGMIGLSNKELKRLNKEIRMDRGDKVHPKDEAFVVTSNIEQDNSKLWEDLVLTVKEDYIIEALRIIEPKIVRIDKRKVRLKGFSNPVPLKNMGDGINRIFTIALAFASSAQKILLIDEFEVGLHYTFQEKLWSFIFQLSKKLDVQVFATTHSRDCISTFSYVANRPEFEGLGNYFRLGKKRGSEDIIDIPYSLDELELALSGNIETR